MRIVLVTNDFPPKPGGIQQYLGNLVEAWPDAVVVLAPSDYREDDRPRAGVEVRRHRKRFMWPTPGIRRWIVAAARELEAEAVVFGAPYPLARMAAQIGRELSVPTAIVCHGAEITIPSALPGARTFLKASLRGADAVLAVSRFTQSRVARLIRGPVSYIGSGVDAGAFRPAEAAQQAPGPPIVGCVSRFVPRKGQHRLIEAAARLRASGREVSLLFVGAGRRRAALERQAARSSVPARFEVGVPFDALPGLYREMDVFCMPCRSRWAGLEVEGLGIVYLEAAASGLPVLAGDSGGAPETVRPAETGFVVHSVGDIVEGLTMLLDDPERAARMGAAGREYVTATYSWPLVARRLEDALAAAGRG